MTKIILKALVGSHLYGLNTEDSDEDYNGVFVAPTHEILSLKKPTQTIVTHDPDSTLHEVEKFISLAAKANPTVLELLYCPEYIVYTKEAQLLHDNREAFLSNTVRASFGGYAWQQAVKLQKRESEGYEGFGPRTKKRYAKHARHCFRLLHQGRQLLTTGTLSPKLSNPLEIFAVGKLSVDELIKKFHKEYESFKQVESILPDEPNWEALNYILLEIRRMNP